MNYWLTLCQSLRLKWCVAINGTTICRRCNLWTNFAVSLEKKTILPWVVEDIIKQINEKFGQESPLSTTRGKVLEYLGMTIDYTTAGKVKISRYKFMDSILTELPIDMNGTARTPAAGHLFNLRDNIKKLPKDTAQLFHHLVAKLLFLSRRKRQDIQMAEWDNKNSEEIQEKTKVDHREKSKIRAPIKTWQVYMGILAESLKNHWKSQTMRDYSH